MKLRIALVLVLSCVGLQAEETDARKKALIIGITGQDGAYLSEFLLKKGYEVHGIKRRASLLNTARIDHLYSNEHFILHYGDVTDACNIVSIMQQVKPDAPVPEGIAPQIAALRSRRKKLSGLCLFLVLTALIMGLRATFFYNYYLAIGLIIVAAVYAWRVYRKPVSLGWV